VLHSSDARVLAAAVYDHPVADSQRRIRRLRDADRYTVSDLHDDVLTGPPIRVVVLDVPAEQTAAQGAHDREHIASSATAELMPKHATCHGAKDHSNPELVIAFERDRIDALDPIEVDLLLSERLRRSAGRPQQSRQQYDNATMLQHDTPV
jgi:hypothetical protein